MIRDQTHYHSKAEEFSSRAPLRASEVAKILGVSDNRIRQLAKEKVLRCTGKNARGEFTFDPLEVLRYAVARNQKTTDVKKPAELVRQAFALFERKATLGECVIELNQSPDVIRALYREWQTPLGGKPPEKLEDERLSDHESFIHDLEEREKADRARAEARIRYWEKEFGASSPSPKGKRK